MACTLIQMYSGAQLVNAHKGKPIGFFTENEIDADIANNPNGNEMLLALTDMTTWIGACSVDLDALNDSDDNCKWLGEATKWLAILRYAMLHNKLKENCCEDDQKLIDLACKMILEYLGRVSDCLVNQFLDWLEVDPKSVILDEMWGTTLIEECTAKTEDVSDLIG